MILHRSLDLPSEIRRELAGRWKIELYGGLGDVISSWIGTGSNLPISGSQLQNVLGNDTISRLASQSGLSTENVQSQLAHLLPQVVDKLTPNGQLPAGGDLLSNLTAGLKGLF